MLIITTIFYAEPETKRDRVTGQILKNKPADLQDATRKLVCVHQGMNQEQPNRSS